jgi:hypothetical protein
MKIGTKSILFGTHQFLWHPLTVILAWRRLFKVWPTWKETVCIFLHDTPGYWGKPNIDGPEGRVHPELGAKIAERLFGRPYGDFTRFHSRDYSRTWGGAPSKLCWADKYSVMYDPRWFYLFRAKLSGEVDEFRNNAPEYQRKERDIFWLNWYRTKVRNIKEIRELLDERN